MKKILILLFFSISLFGQRPTNEIKGICLGLPSPDRLDDFIKFAEDVFIPAGINTIIFRVDYNYQYQSLPHLGRPNGWSKDQITKLVEFCRKNGMEPIPLVNMMGHQSNGTQLNPLLTHYPQFDETPRVKMPEVYVWPNEDELYCKSYCPLHPEVHSIVFQLIDEIIDAFDARYFHAGMDEVFYIGDIECPRCQNQDKSVLFANEVNKINDFVKGKNAELMIWADRMIDGEATGLGMWEGSENDTYRSVDLIDRSVILTDWHYDSAPDTYSFFIDKGYRVTMSPWNKKEVVSEQWDKYLNYENKDQKYMGFIQTVWTSTNQFMDYYRGITPETGRAAGTVDCFKTLIDLWSK